MSASFVNITIPVLNETKRLRTCVPKLLRYLARHDRLAYEIVIADNGSTDGTLAVAEELARQHPTVRVIHLEAKGRGRALKGAWSQTGAEILTYMDVDLATDLAAFPTLVDAVAKNGFDVAVGSRLLPGSHVQRGWKREVVSRGYVWLLRTLLHVRFSDTQCGFKAISRRAAQALLPVVEDTGWFFDTELLVLAERLGYRICDVPVRWLEDPDSRVNLVSTAWGNLKGLLRLKRRLATGCYAHSRVVLNSEVEASE